MLMPVRTALLIGALALPAGVAQAQTSGMDQSDRQQAQRSTQQAGMQSSAGAVDRQTQQQLVQMLRMGNQAEIELGQFAEQRAQNDQVKQFAQQMQQDHQKFLQQLDRATPAGQAMGEASDTADATRERLSDAGGMTATGGSAGTGTASSEGDMSATGGASAAENRERGASAGPNAGIGDRDSTTGAGNAVANASRTGQTGQADTRSAMSGAAGATTSDASSQVYGFAAGSQSGLAQVMTELHRQHMQSTREMLSEKQGSEFDKAYIGQQIMMHQSMLDKLQVFSQHVDPSLQPVLQQGQQTVQQHMEEAKQIMDQLKQQQG